MINKNFTHIADALKSMAHPDRLRILNLLDCKKICTVTDIQRALKITQSMTSQHLLSMKAQGVLQSKKKKNKVYYSIKNPQVTKVIKCMTKCQG